MYLNNLFSLSRKINIVTGSGQVADLRLAKAGAKVITFYRPCADKSTKKLIDTRGHTYHISTDFENGGVI
jgi:hypothetical protein